MAKDQKAAPHRASFFSQKPVSPPRTAKRQLSTSKGGDVHDFFKPASKKPKVQKIAWRIIDNSCLVGKYASEPNANTEEIVTPKKKPVAVFDLDHTLIKTKSGNTFPRDANDWVWWDAQVPRKLKELHSDGYQVVILSNQKKVLLKHTKKSALGEPKSLSIFKDKAGSIMRALDVPLSVYAATEYDEYRKPRIGMWNMMLDDYDLNMEGAMDLQGSVFVGDAAGRPGDHSCVDRNFATNVGIAFKTPEEFFRGEAAQAVEVFDPRKLIQTETNGQPAIEFTKPPGQELVIFCGSPGAGKSTFYWKYLEPLGYERVNQDILKTVSMELLVYAVTRILQYMLETVVRPKCLKVASEYLQAGKYVAVDNTNANVETREHWISMAKEHKVPIRCVYFSTPQDICNHNNAVRAANSKLESINPENRTFLPPVAFRDFLRRFEEPQLSEGLQEIIRVDFLFEGDAAAKQAWSQHW
ncbi:DNA kinase/phosphatase Pnk1, partial [Ophidiomyces ophidiicola]